MMNSGGAQVFQAGPPQLISTKGKGKSKGAAAASLIGSLFAQVPGAAQFAQGFDGLLQQLRGQKLGLGIQPTRKSTVAGQSSPLAVAGLNRRQTGSTNASVLRLGEADRDNQSSLPVRGTGDTTPSVPGEGIATPSAAQGRNGNPAGASVPASMQSGSGKEGPVGIPPGPVGVDTGAGVNADARLAEVTPGITPTVIFPGHKPGAEGADKSSQPTDVHMGSGPLNSASPSADGQTRVLRNAGVNRPSRSLGQLATGQAGDAQSGNPSSGVNHSNQARLLGARNQFGLTQSNRIAVQDQPDNSPIAVNGEAEGSTSRIVTSQLHQNILPTQSRTTGVGEQITGDNTTAGRFAENGRPELSQSLTSRQEVPINMQRTSGHTPSSNGPMVQSSTDAGIASARQDGQRPGSAVPGEGLKGDGLNPAIRLTNEDGSQRSAPAGDQINRDFVKPVTLGIRQKDGRMGDGTPATVSQSLPTPAPATVGMTADLASLARITALYHSRFSGGEQRGSVFTFNGGSLGNVQLTFQESDSGTTLHILVESPEVRQVLQRALPSLEQEWMSQGLNLANVSVEAGDTGREGSFTDQGNFARIPATDSMVTEEVSIDNEIERSVRDYGYNTVEYVA